MRPRSRETVGEHRFVAFGVRLVLRTHGDGITLFGADQHPLELPPGWREDEEADAAPPLAYDLLAVAPLRSCRQYELRNGAEIVAAGNHLPQLLGAFTAHAEFLIAQQAPEHLFVHAGAVVWQGMGVVMPGHSLSGKTSLVRAFLEAGATYYSRRICGPAIGRDTSIPTRGPSRSAADPAVRPRACPPGRSAPGSAGSRVPVGLILVTTHRPGVAWRPRCIARSRAAIALMAHAVAARGDPRHSMPNPRRDRSERGRLRRTSRRGDGSRPSVHRTLRSAARASDCTVAHPSGGDWSAVRRIASKGTRG